MHGEIEEANADRFLADVEALHSAPRVVQQVLRLLRKPEFSMRDVAKCIESDPALSAQLLRLVNSSSFGLHRRVSAVKQAVNILGERTIRTIVLSFGLVKSLSSGAPARLYDEFWRRSLATASATACLAERTADLHREDGFTAGLLADVGVLLLAQRETDRYAGLCDSVPHGAELVAAERDLFGFSHPVLGARLLERWSLPEPMIAAIRGHHDEQAGDGLEAALRAGHLLAEAVLHRNRDVLAQLQSLLRTEFDMDTDGLIDVVEHCRLETESVASEFGVRDVRPPDYEGLIDEARGLHAATALETAMELDSLDAVYQSAIGS